MKEGTQKSKEMHGKQVLFGHFLNIERGKYTLFISLFKKKIDSDGWMDMLKECFQDLLIQLNDIPWLCI